VTRVRRIAWVLVPIALLAILGVAVFASREPQAGTAFTLRVGDCFDVPNAAQVGDVPPIACDQPHDAEVFVAAAYPVPSPATAIPPYPGEAAFAGWVADNCAGAAFQAYVGQAYGTRPDLSVAYFFPPADAWTRGERQVTCYLAQVDGTKVSTSLRSAGATPGALPAGSGGPASTTP
jgi:hypothetical protein